MAIGRLQAALASATNEVTVAAANLNFDFTLIKCEAPKEYQALGNALSTKRKENAEFGSSHVLARQLGALFDGVCPPTPALLEAYGNRASEIAKAASGLSKPFSGTLFSDYTGIDGTSIWAAATSSRSALHIHLLACLLARVWSAPEAIAIWVELVSERKKEIARKVDEGEPVPFALAAAVGQDISRPQLAGLDNSARAWLRTADDIFYTKQKQLDLILKNLDLSISGGLVVFRSVIQTWKIALETMNKLVSGIPQAVQDGAALLGLSAWHLYPNMSIYSPGFVEVDMEDSNIAEGGILSLGVSRRPNSSNLESGVHWSLSLPQLRHYGRPITMARSLENLTRLTWPQFRLVLFAALTEILGLQDVDHGALASFLPSLLQDRRRIANTRRRRNGCLRDAASAYANCMTVDQELNHKLIQLGRRRARRFLAADTSDFKGPRPLAASTFNFGIFLSVFNHVNSAVAYFRHVAQSLSNDSTPADAFLIRHRIVKKGGQITAMLYEDGWEDEYCYLRRKPSSPEDNYAVITALTPPNEEETDSAPHHRWLPPARYGNIPVPDGETSSQDVLAKFWCGHTCLQAVAVERDECHVYRPVLGDPNTVMLFARHLPGNERMFDLKPTIEDFQWCLDHNLLNCDTLWTELSELTHSALDNVSKTLQMLEEADLVYRDITDATIDPDILTRPLISTRWAKNCRLDQFRHEPALSMISMISMISYFETGVHDIDPELLKDVIAVSHADSLYVPSALIQDPYESIPPWKAISFRRILGNIGKPGLTFLLPPQEPMMREIDTGSWRLDSYHHFDGTRSQSFQNTSMHLSFTTYHIPIYDGVRGSYDNQIFFLESVISVQDRGEWIADVDPSSLIYESLFQKFDIQYKGEKASEDQTPCQHRMNTYSGRDMTAVDTWNELLDTPTGMFVVRTGDNWVSRLASALVVHQRMIQSGRKIPIIVCPPEVCWNCVKDQYEAGAFIF